MVKTAKRKNSSFKVCITLSSHFSSNIVSNLVTGIRQTQLNLTCCMQIADCTMKLNTSFLTFYSYQPFTSSKKTIGMKLSQMQELVSENIN